MGLARIPRSKIVEYAEEMELTESETYDLVFVINAMDAAWLKRLAEKREESAKNASRPG